jgi:hypothetical protein
VSRVGVLTMGSRGRPRTWTAGEIEALTKLWPAHSVAQIANLLSKSPGAVCAKRHALGLPKKIPIFHLLVFSNQRFFLKLPLTPGVKKLLDRAQRLSEWVDEGRDNYELARAFHVPIADVAYVIKAIGLRRADEFEVSVEPLVPKQCGVCRRSFAATRYRFRCNDCLSSHSGLFDTEHSLEVQ